MACTDPQLLQAMASGDGGAFTELYDRHAARVFGLLLKLLRNRGDAEDVLQETFWQVWKRAAQYDPTRSSVDGWLFLLARSRALDLLRRRRFVANAVAEEPGVTADPAAGVERNELAQLLNGALDRLPEEQRQAICLSFFVGLTHEEIARRLGLPLGTVKTRIRLGMGRLRDQMGKRPEVATP